MLNFMNANRQFVAKVFDSDYTLECRGKSGFQYI